MTDPEYDRPSTYGAILGMALFQIAEAGRRAMGAGTPDMCATCAFRPGSMPNQSATTGLLAFNCAIGIDRDGFGCHHGLSDGIPTRDCAGWLVARHAPFEVVKEVTARVSDILSRIQQGDPDPIRLAFDKWRLEVDPKHAMDNYQLARLMLRQAPGEAA